MRKNKVTPSRFFKSDKGGIAVLFAFTFPIVIGMLAFAIDTGFLFDQKRHLQVSSDAAALEGAYALKSGKPLADIEQDAFADAKLNGFAGVMNDMTLNTPPLSGAYVGSKTAVEVILNKTAEYYFLKYFLSSFSIHARSVTHFDIKELCAFALGSGSQNGLTIIGSTQVIFKGCGININSPSSTALSVSGTGSLTADTLEMVGNYDRSGSGTITTLKPIITGSSYTPDPYASLTIPSYTSQICLGTSYSTAGKATLNPGRYCNGIALKSKANVTLNPGTYIIDGGGLDVSSQSTIAGNGVTIIFTSATNTNYGTANFSAGATATLSAPTSGTFQGILFFSDRRATAITTKIAGSASMILTGLLYFPSSSLEYVGGSGSSGVGCLKFIASSLKFSGNSTFTSNNCNTSSIKVASALKLVE